VILVPPGVRILLAAQPVDFRKGMDGLAALVQQALRADPFRGDVFIFRAKRADRVTLCIPPFKTRAVSASLPLVDQRSSWVAARRFLVRLS
jgi:IS66 Orf2 like protein